MPADAIHSVPEGAIEWMVLALHTGTVVIPATLAAMRSWRVGVGRHLIAPTLHGIGVRARPASIPIVATPDKVLRTVVPATPGPYSAANTPRGAGV